MEPSLHWLTDPTVFAVNRLPAHSDHAAFGPGGTPLRQSLDGVWQFAYSPNPAARPAEFWKNDFDTSNFAPVAVPGHIELQGYGRIQYINTLYPWDGHAELRPPEIDWDRTAVGSYVREFDLDPALRSKPVCISFQGVEKAFFLWLNGQFVGYAEDSFTSSDFDLTPYLKDTGNRLCVEVYQHSSASWLEDQDMFRFFGIFRSVFLYAKPAAHLSDVWLQAGLDGDNTTGTLTLRLKTEGAPAAVHFTLDGLFDGALALRQEGDALVSQPFRFAGITPWCHKTPRLYEGCLTLSVQGEAVEQVPVRVGFRRFELKNGVMCLNGERIVFHGVNRHEWNPERGRAVTEADMTAAIETFRRSNIDAVRTCHYPNQSRWYDLCDENGIYVMDETDLESHGSWQKLGRVEPSWNVPGSLPQWRACVLDRARNMLERDKNHPAILLWSCGNESYAGSNILAMTEYFHQTDPSRLVHYEGVFHCREFDACSDAESRMYATPQEIRAYLQNAPKKPFVLCEYMHDMGNSLGGMAEYVRLAEEFEQYQGGFIWDYMDQALWHTDAAGRRVLGYGGDFGERQSDYNFSANGIVFADGAEKPAMQEVRYQYASAAAKAAHDAANAAARADAERLLRQEQARPNDGADLTVTHGDGALGVRGQDFEVLFSKPEGGPVSLRRQGREWLWRAPRPALWRAATENDVGSGFAKTGGIWSAADAWQQCTAMEVTEESEKQVCVRYTYAAPAVPGLEIFVCYTVDTRGRVAVDCRMTPDAALPGLPCFGMRFSTPLPLDRVDWQGLSGETYPDRKQGGVYGTHSETPHIPDYLVPQDCGCHCDTTRALLRQGGAVLELQQTERPFAFSALPYEPRQLDAAFHKEELPAPVRTVVTVYGAMRGVGGIDSWGSEPQPEFCLPAGRTYTLHFYLC